MHIINGISFNDLSKVNGVDTGSIHKVNGVIIPPSFSNLWAARGNGISSYGFNSAIDDNLKLLDTFSVSLWVYPNARLNNQYIFELSDDRRGGTFGPQKFLFYISQGTAGGTILFNVRTNDISGNRIWFQYFNYPINEWYNLVFRVGVNSLELFVNGVLGTPVIVNNNTQSGNMARPDRMSVGAQWVPGYYRYFTQFDYDELNIFNRHLTSGEITQLAEGTRDVSAWSGLVGSWRFENNGEDSAGNNDLTLSTFGFTNANLPPAA
jgi:hypothetical protein